MLGWFLYNKTVSFCDTHIFFWYYKHINIKILYCGVWKAIIMSHTFSCRVLQIYHSKSNIYPPCSTLCMALYFSKISSLSHVTASIHTTLVIPFITHDELSDFCHSLNWSRFFSEIVFSPKHNLQCPWAYTWTIEAARQY